MWSIFEDPVISFALLESAITKTYGVFICQVSLDIIDAVAGGDGIREELESVIAELLP